MKKSCRFDPVPDGTRDFDIPLPAFSLFECHAGTNPQSAVCPRDAFGGENVILRQRDLRF